MLRVNKCEFLQDGEEVSAQMDMLLWESVNLFMSVLLISQKVLVTMCIVNRNEWFVSRKDKFLTKVLVV